MSLSHEIINQSGDWHKMNIVSHTGITRLLEIMMKTKAWNSRTKQKNEVNEYQDRKTHEKISRNVITRTTNNHGENVAVRVRCKKTTNLDLIITNTLQHRRHQLAWGQHRPSSLIRWELGHSLVRLSVWGHHRLHPWPCPCVHWTRL